ncbi:MAG: type II secretion system minor pseudopilin GspI [Lautropia sp.]|nr:type II secretion system minor pseudopilin GspI [Lautropia sp.]
MDWAALKSSSPDHRLVQGGARGFTLVEILVALTIVAIALMASIRAVGSLTQSASDLRSRTLAQWSAENRLSQIRVQREYPPVGRRSFDCSQGDLPLQCQEDVFATPNVSFRRIEIQVFDVQGGGSVGVGGASTGGRLARLIGFATNLR